MKLLLLAAVSLSTALAAPVIDPAALFKRADPVPAVGTDAWAALYPASGSTPTSVPKAWTDALALAVAAGRIPNLPPATLNAGYPSYPNGISAQDRTLVCHNTYGCTQPSDVISAPDGRIGLSHDDGPLPPGVRLYDFFKAQNISATHFYIGGNVKTNPQIFLQGLALPGSHYAVHTWSHPYMSGLSNADVVAELGWTMQILSDSNGGRIPAFWRPPFGDVDNRVRAIAKEVFGLTTVIWGPDSADWAIGVSTTEDAVNANLAKWYAGPKSPGLVILQHELNDRAVDAFITSYPLIKSNGWQATNMADTLNMPWYKNALSGTSAVMSGAIAGNGTVSSASAGPASSAVAASSAAASAAAFGSASQAPSSAGSARSSAVSASAARASASASAASSTSSGDRQSLVSVLLCLFAVLPFSISLLV